MSGRLDFSGFDIGTGSTLTWNLFFLFNYRLSKHTSLDLGYRIIGLDYSRGSGTDKFAANIMLNGPVMGVAFDF